MIRCSECEQPGPLKALAQAALLMLSRNRAGGSPSSAGRSFSPLEMRSQPSHILPTYERSHHKHGQSVICFLPWSERSINQFRGKPPQSFHEQFSQPICLVKEKAQKQEGG